jgi:hypothetical protein
LINISAGAESQLSLKGVGGQTVINSSGGSTLNGGINSVGIANVSPTVAAYNFNVKQPNGANGIRVYTANGQNEFHLHYNGGSSAVVRFLSGGDCYFNTGGNVGFGLSTGITEQLTLNGRAHLKDQTAPSTPTGGGTIYVEAGALKYIGSSGTITTLGIA